MGNYEIWTNPYPGEQGALRHVFRRWGESLESVKRAAELMAASGERGVCIVDVPPEGDGRVELIWEASQSSGRRIVCMRCGHEWTPRVATPIRCPHCQTAMYDRPAIECRPRGRPRSRPQSEE